VETRQLYEIIHAHLMSMDDLTQLVGGEDECSYIKKNLTGSHKQNNHCTKWDDSQLPISTSSEDGMRERLPEQLSKSQIPFVVLPQVKCRIVLTMAGKGDNLR